MALRQEVQYYEKMEVRDIHNDMPLAAACQNDVEKFCSNIKSGSHSSCYAPVCHKIAGMTCALPPVGLEEYNWNVLSMKHAAFL